MRKKVKFISLPSFASAITVSSVSLPIAIVNTNNYNIHHQREIEKQKQVEQFKDVSDSDILDNFDNFQFLTNNVQYQSRITSEMKNQNDKYIDNKTELIEIGAKNIQENKDEIIDLTLKVKNGEILISDLIKKEENLN